MIANFCLLLKLVSCLSHIIEYNKRFKVFIFKSQDIFIHGIQTRVWPAEEQSSRPGAWCLSLYQCNVSSSETMLHGNQVLAKCWVGIPHFAALHFIKVVGCVGVVYYFNNEIIAQRSQCCYIKAVSWNINLNEKENVCAHSRGIT